MTRAAALKIGWRAWKRLGVPFRIAYMIAFAARKHDIRWAVAYALFEQESAYRVIYGHDLGGLFPGQRVTEDNYRTFRSEVVRRRGGGANGVGLGQVTYWTYIRDHAGLWKPRVQVYLSLSILADLLSRHDERTALAAYNGGEGNPNYSYADEVLSKARAIRPKLAKRSK